jgi:uncharacterized membrane protein (DUF373 family)
MDKNKTQDSETSIIPPKYVDIVEDVFHAILAISLLGIGIGAFFYSGKRLIETQPFFPNGMIQGVNDILFIVIILEILRTVISRFTDGVYQLDKFLIIGVIAAVRHILTVGASLTLESGKSDTAFERSIYEMGLNALIVVVSVLPRSNCNGQSIFTPSSSAAAIAHLGFLIIALARNTASAFPDEMISSACLASVINPTADVGISAPCLIA